MEKGITMKSLIKSKKLFAFSLVLVLMVSLCIPTASAAIPPTSGRLKVTNYAYQTKVMNVYTSGSPASGSDVTLYSPSGSAAQSWYNVFISGTKYRMECYYQASLALNYNQATTKCTVYTHSGNVANDYQLSYLNGNNDTIIYLSVRGRCLGTSGSGNGAQLYWYLGNPTIEENWIVTKW
jgi:hypothetical protein